MHLLFITFGDNERHHLQAHFCYYSFLAAGADLSSVNIMTDRPEFYKTIEKGVNVITVTQQTLTEWKGPYNYFWRIKIKAIEQLCLLHPGEAVMYLDTDTFLYAGLEPALLAMSEGRALMHERETPLATLPTKTARRMYAAFKGRPFENISDVGAFDMWNAGVVITPNTRQGEEMSLALRLTDDLCSQLVVTFIEQYCLSIALQQTYGLEPASGYIAHYWSNKDEWNSLISQFFHRNYMQELGPEEIIASFRQLPLFSIPDKRIVKNSKVRLKKFIDRLFSDKKITYLDRH